MRDSEIVHVEVDIKGRLDPSRLMDRNYWPESGPSRNLDEDRESSRTLAAFAQYYCR